ncbi:hypothetical protein SAMN05660668_02834, partial [Pseudobutyrivibrio sp. AR14]|uniref:hypothetical protein n=1 Tax=Pseudobutyrivibrio sp. AR14 TaxID=1520804 RepID=UPI00088F0422
GALGAGVTGFTMEYVDEVYINPALRANILNDEAAYNIDYKQVLINSGIAGAFTAGAYYMQAAAASRNTAKVMANENVKIDAIDSPKAVVEEVGVEGGKEIGWDMPEGGGTINGREYSQHALERMAPDTPAIRAELSRRAEILAEKKGLEVGTLEYYKFCEKYVDPRNIPPSVIEDAILNASPKIGRTEGTFVYQTADVTVIVNETGKVITVIPR